MAVAWVFPGQGAQVVGMGRDLYTQIPAAREVFDRANEILNLDISRLCFEGPEDDLTATQNAQPALLTVCVALLRTLRALNPTEEETLPQIVAGHSLGEYAALVAGGALDLETAVRLVRRRGELMAASASSGKGMMAAILGLEEAVVDQLCQDASSDQTGEWAVIANYNAPGQLVISGSMGAVEQVTTAARASGARRVVPLRVSGAFHSPLMTEATAGMAKAVAEAPIRDLHIPLVANVTASILLRADEIRKELVAQVGSPVRWVGSVQQMVSQGISTFVEIGPGNVLTGLIKRIAPGGVRLVNLRSVEDIKSFF